MDWTLTFKYSDGAVLEAWCAVCLRRRPGLALYRRLPTYGSYSQDDRLSGVAVHRVPFSPYLQLDQMREPRTNV